MRRDTDRIGGAAIVWVLAVIAVVALLAALFA